MADREFITHLVDMLSPLGVVRARAMFGGHGFYLDDLMFALVADGELYFKVDAESEPRFVAADLPRFEFRSKAGRVTTMSYRRAPGDAIDDGDTLVEWGRLGVEASLRAARAKLKKTAKKKKNQR